MGRQPPAHGWLRFAWVPSQVPSGADLKLGDALPTCGLHTGQGVRVSPGAKAQVTGDQVQGEAWMQAPENAHPPQDESQLQGGDRLSQRMDAWE